MADSVVRARIDPALKKSASAVLKRIGLTTSDAVRLMMVRIAAEKKLPFDPLVPQQENDSGDEGSTRRLKSHKRVALEQANKRERR